MTEYTIGYVRVSTEEQARTGVSLDFQEEQIRRYGELHSVGRVKFLIDDGYTGRRERRPGYQELLFLVRSGVAKRVIAWKLDRLSRVLRELISLAALLERHDVPLSLITDQVDTGSAQGRLFFHLLGSLAQWESELIGERTSAGLAEKRRRGEYCGGGVPWGYEIEGRKLVASGGEQEMISRVRSLHSLGHTDSGIAAIVEAEGFTTRRGTAIHRRQIARILASVVAA